MNNLQQYLSCCCILLVVTVKYMAEANGNQRAEKISNMIPSVIDKWEKVEDAYDRMVSQNVRDTFGKGFMNMFMKQSREKAHFKVTRGFYSMDPAVHVLFSNLEIQHQPIMEKITIDIQIPGNSLIFKSQLTNVHIKTLYSLHRLNPNTITNSDRPVAGVSPFLLQKVEEYGDVTIVADRCYFEGIFLLIPSEQTFAVANRNYKITNCNFNLEILSKVAQTAPLFVQYFIADEAKSLQSLLAQTLGTSMDLSVKTVLVSTFNTSKLFDEHYQITFGFAYTFFNSYLSALWSGLLKTINDDGKGNNVNLDSMDLDTQFKFLWMNKVQSMDVQITKLELHGLNTAYSSHTGTAVKCDDCPKVLLVESIHFSRLQIIGLTTRSGADSKFSAELKDVQVLVSLVENVKEKTKSLYTSQITGFRNIEYLFTDTSIELQIRDMLASSITAHIIRILPQYVTGYITDNVPAALDKRNNAPIPDDDTLRELLTALFGDLE